VRPGRERHLHVVAGLLRRLLDGRASAEHDEVGERHLLAAGCVALNAFWIAFERREHLREFGRLVRLPVLLRRETDAGAVGAAALVGAAERRGRRPRRGRRAATR
jgi:hypothetical protein